MQGQPEGECIRLEYNNHLTKGIRMGVSLEQAQTMLDAYLAAENAVLSGQSYTMGSRTLTRANIEFIRKGRQEWEQKVNSLSGIGSVRVRPVIFRDS